VNRPLLHAVSRIHAAVYRASRGRLLGSIGKGMPVLLLTTTGRKSGRRRTTPLLYLEDGGRYAVVASVGGAPQHPAWYLNLRADPRATVEIGGRTRAVRAETAGPEERARLWRAATAMYPGYDTYQARTSREIPIVTLTPAE
jgi:deazaflavin-dependent oxidoreductase (nitroreductase family)